MIGARFGDHFGAILGYLGASGADLGVSRGALGLDFWAKLISKLFSNLDLGSSLRRARTLGFLAMRLSESELGLCKSSSAFVVAVMV